MLHTRVVNHRRYSHLSWGKLPACHICQVFGKLEDICQVFGKLEAYPTLPHDCFTDSRRRSRAISLQVTGLPADAGDAPIGP